MGETVDRSPPPRLPRTETAASGPLTEGVSRGGLWPDPFLVSHSGVGEVWVCVCSC